jgi:hypothetical protein
MTTSVTVKTHDWPVAVTENASHFSNSDKYQSHGNSITTRFVPANSEATFSVTDSLQITVRELPKDATGLNYGAGGAANADPRA